MSPLEQALIQKAATDCGFDRTPEFAGEQVLLGSAAFPETLRVQVVAPNVYLLLSGWPLRDDISGFENGRAHVAGTDGLYRALQRFTVLARTWPNRVADAFAKATGTMPRATEAERVVVQRIGQSLFRAALLDYWGRRCCMTGLDVSELLRASHIKPWALCTSDDERLDVYNGLLLAPHLDALFDGGWITVEDNGKVCPSERLSQDARARLGLPSDLAVNGLTEGHRAYLVFHQATVFRV